MNLAFGLLTAIGVVFVAAAVTLFNDSFDQPVAAWFCLISAALITLTVISAVVSTALADRTVAPNANANADLNRSNA
jgi:cytosine/uracil/thiamine/allantoin permease